MPTKTRLPGSALIRLWRRTIIVSLLSAAASVALSEGIMLVISRGMDLQGVFAATVLPVVIGTPIIFVLMLRGEQLRHANQRLEILASTDALTGALNRRSFSTRVDTHLETSRHQSTALLVIDVDHFKQVNDRFGHESGDRALELIADTLRGRLGPHDLVGRLGGEEFGIMLADCDTANVQRVADDLREAVRAIAFEGSSGRHALSISVGCVVAPPGDNAGFAQLYRVADRNLYAAKSAGRDRTVIDAPRDSGASLAA